MNTSSSSGTPQHTVHVADLSLSFRDVTVPSEAPTGQQLAVAAGFRPGQQPTVLEILSNGELEDVRADEVVGLGESTRKFIIVESDRSYKLEIDKVSATWPARMITGAQIRKLGHIPPEMEVFLDLPGDVQRVIHDHDLLDLNAPGIERIKTRPRIWKLNVQGVTLTIHHPTIQVRQAIEDAGFNAKKPWIIVLRVRGEPKREVGLDYVIDLRTPGIEKLRLTPREVNNGEAPSAPRREFALLDADLRFLEGLGLPWETTIDTTNPKKARRWLLIHDYPVPPGYTAQRTLLALEIPPTYPGAQIDMFYTHPALSLASGQAIPKTESKAVIQGVTFNRWSRHRGAQSPWDENTDNVATHLALVESALVKESGQ